TAAAMMSALALAVALPRPASATEIRHDESVLIPSTQVIHSDLIASGASVRIDGTVEGDLIAFTGILIVTGHVTGDIIAFAGQMWLRGRNLFIGPTAEIGGAATFRGFRKPNVAAGAKLASPLRIETQEESRRLLFSGIRVLVDEIVGFGVALLLGIVFVTIL